VIVLVTQEYVENNHKYIYLIWNKSAPVRRYPDARASHFRCMSADGNPILLKMLQELRRNAARYLGVDI
jgi:hypothetical protein